ncbi:MAG: hypothetical protein KKC75_02920 [Nanoarchaeota archaeon]|nr:hypothetical protein [Nanoarchaeota archaeon]MBU1005750.1 hypothetical protein [Nanoarchaeota archaeon]MBU1946440.1 hypothetical protein [Nanoarchaeota archaeon]
MSDREKRELLSRVRKQFDYAKGEFKNAERFMKENERKHLVISLFSVFESCIDIAKDIKDSRPLTSHEEKTKYFKWYFDMGFFKDDYSEFHLKLNQYRKRAQYEQYSGAPKIPEVSNLTQFMDQAKKILSETEYMIKKLKD